MSPTDSGHEWKACERMRDLKEYYRPSTPEEAVSIKEEYGDRAAYLAGGSDLLVHRPPQLQAMIDIRHAGLGYVRQKDGEWAIGGAALLRDAEAECRDVAGGMLTLALRDTAPWLIRNAATVAGNIANASPAADAVPALIALDAKLVLLGGGDARIPVRDALAGPHRTTLGDRLIREIRLPPQAARSNAAFIKLARSKSDIAQVNVAVCFTLEDGIARDVRIALGAVAPTAVRAPRTEALVEGQRIGTDLLDEAQRTVRDEVSPIDDWRATAEYRRRQAGVLVRRAIQVAAGGSVNGVTD